MSNVGFPAKVAAALVTLRFDFRSQLASGETISSATCAASVYSGTDAAPSGMISGSASISGTVVSQNVTGGTAGVIYEIACTATTSAGQSLVMPRMLAVVPEL